MSQTAGRNNHTSPDTQRRTSASSVKKQAGASSRGPQQRKSAAPARKTKKMKRSDVTYFFSLLMLIVAVVALCGFLALVWRGSSPETPVASSSDSAVSASPLSNESGVPSQSSSSQQSESLSAESASVSPQSSSSAPVSSVVPADPNDPYPMLYVNKPGYIPHEDGDKVVYLTFDDGPSEYTIPLLDTLDKYGVKATFFDCGVRSDTAEKAMKEVVKRGHVLGVHTYTHKFGEIYASTDAFLEDFYKEWDYIHSVTGTSPEIFRFAGGSYNSYNEDTADAIIEEMNRRGYTYYDWNVDSGDATGNNIPVQTIYDNVISGVSGKEKAVVLMHNTGTKRTTLEAMPQIIEQLQSMGYRFDVLTNRVAPIQF